MKEEKHPEYITNSDYKPNSLNQQNYKLKWKHSMNTTRLENILGNSNTNREQTAIAQTKEMTLKF